MDQQIYGPYNYEGSVNKISIRQLIKSKLRFHEKDVRFCMFRIVKFFVTSKAYCYFDRSQSIYKLQPLSQMKI